MNLPFPNILLFLLFLLLPWAALWCSLFTGILFLRGLFLLLKTKKLRRLPTNVTLCLTLKIYLFSCFQRKQWSQTISTKPYHLTPFHIFIPRISKIHNNITPPIRNSIHCLNSAPPMAKTCGKEYCVHTEPEPKLNMTQNNLHIRKYCRRSK